MADDLDTTTADPTVASTASVAGPPSADDDADRSARLARLSADGRTPARWRTTAHWARWLHVYTSMISLLIVLFFGLTGITLNHPDWTFGQDPVRNEYAGSLPDGSVTGDSVDFLAVTEYIRSNYDVSAAVADYGVAGGQGTVSFKGPGYAADLVFQADTGDFTLVIEEQGVVAVLNDLHKGRDTGSGWKWVIDVSGGLLVVVAVTGLAIQLLMRKRRTRAVVVSLVGGIATIVLIVVTMV